MDRIEIVVATLMGLYFAAVVAGALRRGRIRYRTRLHARATEPGTYWLVVGWFGLLAVAGLAVAALRGREVFGR